MFSKSFSTNFVLKIRSISSIHWYTYRLHARIKYVNVLTVEKIQEDLSAVLGLLTGQIR